MRDGETEEGKYMAVVRDSSLTFATNALRFDTPESARHYADDLCNRWLAMTSYAVIPADTPRDNNNYWTEEIVSKVAIGGIVKA